MLFGHSRYYFLDLLKTYGETMYDLNRNLLQELKQSQDIIQKFLTEKLELKSNKNANEFRGVKGFGRKSSIA
jgi:hypothetical protein